MSAHAQVYPGAWAAGTPDLGTLDLTYVKPISDASHYWSSLQLPVGELPAWTDRASGVRLVAPSSSSQVPAVYSGARKVARFDGQDDRLDVPIDMTGPRTVAVVGRFGTTVGGEYLIAGGNAGGQFNLYHAGNGNIAFYAGKALSSTKPWDTSNHVFIMVSDGANSVLRIDGQEWAGDAGNVGATALRLGASNSGRYGNVDVQAVAVLPFAANTERRAALHAQLKAQYNL